MAYLYFFHIFNYTIHLFYSIINKTKDNIQSNANKQANGMNLVLSVVSLNPLKCFVLVLYKVLLNIKHQLDQIVQWGVW